MKRLRPFGGGAGWLLAALIPLLVMAAWGFHAAWRLGGDTKMGVHGWIAMGLAAVLVLGLGGGLMWLSFYSSRHGYEDDQSGQ